MNSRSWCLVLLMVAPQLSWAVGTTAGTVISNLATVSYRIGSGAPSSATSNTVSLRVDEIIQPVLTWQDATPVAVSTPGSNAVLTFLLTNGGNGPEAFGLTRTNGPAPLPLGNYTPLNGSVGSIYLESGALPGFQASGPNADRLYVSGSNDPALAPNASITLYVVSNTPGVASNLHGEVLLSAAALTVGAAGALPGTALAGLGQGGGFAVVGSSRAQAGATGGYITSGLGLALNKTVLKVLDPRGTSVVMPGAEMTYQIVATLSGAGTASGLVITDPLPATTTYVAGSMVVDGLVQTDAADADLAQFMAAAQTVSVSLGNVASPANVVITFRATIN
jgi:uncharacterized repeat protein (TIGR01451 family)